MCTIVAQAKYFSILIAVEPSYPKMKFVVAVLLLLTPALGFKMEVATTSSLTFDVADAKNRPVSKVITLLKDMRIRWQAMEVFFVRLFSVFFSI